MRDKLVRLKKELASLNRKKDRRQGKQGIGGAVRKDGAKGDSALEELEKELQAKSAEE